MDKKDNIMLVIGCLASGNTLVLDHTMSLRMDKDGRVGYTNQSNDIITGDLSIGTLGQLLETYNWYLV